VPLLSPLMIEYIPIAPQAVFACGCVCVRSGTSKVFMSEIIESKSGKKWSIPTLTAGQVSEVSAIADALHLQPTVAALLHRRGYRTPEDARQFLCMECEMLQDPFLLKGIDEAVARIRQAIERKEKILIYGDYDVDGVTSVCTAYLYLHSKGAEVYYFIPTRGGDGHGVSKATVKDLSEKGISLIITVDTGITAVEEVEYAKTLGIDFVITDHHECLEELPGAVSIVNPHQPDCHYPFLDLAGVGVLFKVICAMEHRMTGDPLGVCVRRLCDEYADLVAIGTIADVMPIRGENRLIVAYGLHLMQKPRRIGMEALIEAASRRPERRGDGTPFPFRRPQITSGYIGYTIAPRINAAGRILSASIAAALFLTDSQTEAEKLAAMLCTANKQRQDEENMIVKEAYQQIEELHWDVQKDPFLVLTSDFWHPGVIGIVASRLTEHYGVPSILISFEGCDPDAHSDEDMGKGSGRSIKGINLVDALSTCASVLPKFGGHELAAGLSIRRGDVSLLRESVCAFAREMLEKAPVENIVEADAELSCRDITMELAQQLQRLEPFGAGNPVPLFVMRNVKIKEITPVTGGKHSKLIVGGDGVSLTAMYFSHSPAAVGLFQGDYADLLFSVDINEFNGRRTVQLIVRDLRQADIQKEMDDRMRARFEEIWAGARFDKAEDVVPCREDFAAVYRYMRYCRSLGIDYLTHHGILLNMERHYAEGSINFIKLKYIIRILQEMNVLGIEEVMPECYCFQFRFNDTKVDLEKSNILRKLRSQQN